MVEEFHDDLNTWWDGYCDAYNKNNDGPQLINYDYEETKELIKEAEQEYLRTIGRSAGTSATYIPAVSNAIKDKVTGPVLSALANGVTKVISYFKPGFALPAAAACPEVGIGVSVGIKLFSIGISWGAVYELEKFNADGSGIVLLRPNDIWLYTPPIWSWDVYALKGPTFVPEDSSEICEG
jgi:hypothetical protein